MEKMKVELLLIISLLAIQGFSQQQQQQTSGFEIPNYAPKSPEAAAFLKYGEYPVDLSTGVPNIAIPLYTIEGRGLQIPITLDYHAGGIKVAQEASWVGLGWNLNYGAQIILNVVDEVDEGNAMIDQIPSDASIAYYNTHPYDFDQGPQVSEQWDKSRVKDIYNFSSPTASGQFYIRNRSTNDVVVYPPQAFKVSIVSGYSGGSPGGMGFKVVDPQGNTYIFGIREQSFQPTAGPNAERNYTSAWYVSEILTALNDTISFNYEDDGTLVETSKSQRIDITKSVQNCGCSGTQTTNTIGTIVGQISSTNTYSKKIREILFDNGNSKILFDRQSGREDLVNGNSYLQALKIMHKNPSTNEFVLLRGYRFVYSYFNENQTGSFIYLKKRLKLDRIETLLEGDAHTFVYSNVTLPPKDSYSQDGYGYYNGINNLSLIPKTVITSPYSQTIGNADRGVNESNAKAGTLTEIHYPSKGYTKFNLESNRIYGSSTETVDLTASAGSGTYHPDFIYEPNFEDGGGPLSFTYDFTLSGDTTGVISWLAANNAYDRYSQIINNAYQTNSQFVRLTITKHNPNGTHEIKYDTGNKTGGAASNSNQEGIETYTGDLALPAGSYTLKVICYGRNVRMNGQFSYTTPITTTGNSLAAGLRIASIENYDSNNLLRTKKVYDYTMPDDPNKSSGKWINEPYKGYWSRGYRNFDAPQICGPGGESTLGGTSPALSYTMTNTLSSNSVGLAQNSIVYEYVKEKDINVIDQSSNGYTLYNFLWDTDFVLDPSIHIPEPWKRGKLKEKTIYKNGLATFLRKETNNYFEDQSKSSQIIGFKRIKASHVTNVNADNINWVSQLSGCGLPSSFAQANIIFKYAVNIYWEYLKSTEVTENFFNEQNQLVGTVVTTKTYNYNNPSHQQLTSETVTSSNGLLETKYYYPGDGLVSTEPAVSDLIAKNIIGTPLVTQKFRDGTKLQEQKTVYKNWGNDILLPELMQGAKSTDTPETRIRITKVDNTNGNVLELQKENGMKISYIYGYNKTLPVAKIENKGYDSIDASGSAFIQNIQNASNADYNDTSEQSLRDVLATLRNSTTMADAMITTFTYDPLIGVTSVTDPKGDTTYYEYDNQGRLLIVRDKDGNILTANQYHFKY